MAGSQTDIVLVFTWLFFVEEQAIYKLSRLYGVKCGSILGRNSSRQRDVSDGSSQMTPLYGSVFISHHFI